MQQRMTAKEYQEQFVRPAGEPENPYAAKVVFKEDKPKVKPLTGLPQPTEHQIQSMILDRLALVKHSFFWRENSGMMVSEYKGRKRVWRAGISGIPDIMGICNGVPIGIEVKRPGKKPSPDQLAFKRRYEECNGVYILCTDAADIALQLYDGMLEHSKRMALLAKK